MVTETYLPVSRASLARSARSRAPRTSTSAPSCVTRRAPRSPISSRKRAMRCWLGSEAWQSLSIRRRGRRTDAGRCHLVSDSSVAELHAFAEHLGLPRRAFDRDHYDIPEDVRPRALADGAEDVPGRDLVRRLTAAGLRRRRTVPPEPGPRVVLMGLMGAGKSTVGRALVRSTGWTFLDNDRIVEQLAGMPTPEASLEAASPGCTTSRSRHCGPLCAVPHRVLPARPHRWSTPRSGARCCVRRTRSI